MKSFISAMLIFLCSIPLVALASEIYRYEILGVGSSIESAGFWGDRKSTVTKFAGRFYYSAVDTTDLPLAEAGFYQRKSQLTLAHINEEKQNGYKDSELTLEWDHYFSDSSFMLGAGWRSPLFDRINAFATAYFKVGVTPADGLLIWVDQYLIGPVSAISAKHVAPFSEGRAVNVEASVTKWGSGDESVLRFSLASDYYFSKNLSLGAGLGWYRDEFERFKEEGKNFNIRGQYFFNQNVSIQVTYREKDERSWGWLASDEDKELENVYELTLMRRF